MAGNGRRRETSKQHTENAEPQSPLTLRQAAALDALLTERDVKAAAKRAGVGERSLYRWMAEDAAFRAELYAAQSRAIDHAVRRLVGLSSTAIDVLREVMRSEADTVKLRAAEAVLSKLMSLREFHDLEARLAALEQKILREGSKP